MNDISIGLWKNTSKEGKDYYKGVKAGVEINGKKYSTTLFMNTNKKSDNSPDMTLKLSEIKSETKQEDVEVPQNTKTEYETEKSDVVLTDADLPF